MAGGIQKGSEAGSVESKLLDGDVRRVAEAIAQAQEQYYYERGHRNLLNERYGEDVRTQAQIPELANKDINSGVVPDGGMWFDGDRKQTNRKLKVTFEAKHQQNAGNAQERWATNRALCMMINPDAVYITFASGEGAQEGGVLHKYGEDMIKAFPNTKWFYSETGFSQEEIFDIMNTELGLSLTFDQVKPYMETKLSRFLAWFEEPELTPEEIVADVKVKQELNRYDDIFVELVQNESTPLARVWLRIAKEDKVDAKDIAIEMLQKQESVGEIASVLQDIFVV